MKNKIYKMDDETYKLNGARIYAIKNPFGTWEVMNNDKIVANNLSLEEAKKQMIQIEKEFLMLRSKVVNGK